MIVKLQLPLMHAGDGEAQALVYNEDRSFEKQLPITADMRQRMGPGRFKAYFEAEWCVPDKRRSGETLPPAGGVLQLHREVDGWGS